MMVVTFRRFSAMGPGTALVKRLVGAASQDLAIDLALVRRTEEQLATNQDQLARKQDQMAQAIGGLQAAQQDLSKQILALAPPAPKAPPKTAAASGSVVKPSQ